MMRRQRLKNIRKKQMPVSLTELEQALRNIGVSSGQVLQVHSSSDWLCLVEGGPMKVLELLFKILGVNGTLVMPSFPFDWSDVDSLSAGIFDVRRSPSKMGLLTEMFRRLPGVQRSLHPTHPVCAFGQYAEYLTNSHHLDSYPFGPLSPFGRVDAMDGNILLLGVNTDSLTHVHVVEDVMGANFPINVYLPQIIETTVIDNQGLATPLMTRAHNPSISRLRSVRRYEREWERSGVLRNARIGHIELSVIKSAQLTGCLKCWAQKGKTIYE